MNNDHMLKLVLPFFPDASIYKDTELILIPKINIYFLIDGIYFERDLKRKMIEWLSRPAHKGTTNYWMKYVRRGLNSFLKTTWGDEELSIIYTRLGNGVNCDLCYKFIDSGFDISLLKLSTD